MPIVINRQLGSRILMKAIVIVVAIATGALRPFLPTHPLSAPGSYEAFAHLFVGGVLGAWMVSRARWLLYIAISLSLVEVGSATIGVLR